MRHLAGLHRRRPTVARAAVVGALVLVPCAGIAQLTPAVDATVGPVRAGGESATPLGALSPALRLDFSRLAVAASSDLPLSGALRGIAGRASFLGATPIAQRWRLSGGAAVERGGRWGGLATWRGGLTTQFAYARREGGAWGGVELGRVASVDGAQAYRPTTVPNGVFVPGADTTVQSATRVLDPTALRTMALTFGAWRSRGDWIGTLALRAGVQSIPGRPPTLRDSRVTVTFYDTTRVGDSVIVTPRTTVGDIVTGDSGVAGAVRRLTEAETRVAWTHGHVAIVGAAGLRLADWTRDRWTQGPNTATIGWASMDATVALGRYAALTLGAGTRPPALDLAALLAGTASPAGGRARYASIGVRLSPALFQRPALPPAVRPAAATFALAPAAERGTYTLRVRVPAARLVELSGDFTKWQPVTMQRASADGWEVVLPIARGTHQVSIRVDGDAWTAPPGLVRVADDFDGSAGVLVVP